MAPLHPSFVHQEHGITTRDRELKVNACHALVVLNAVLQGLMCLHFCVDLASTVRMGRQHQVSYEWTTNKRILWCDIVRCYYCRCHYNLSQRICLSYWLLRADSLRTRDVSKCNWASKLSNLPSGILLCRTRNCASANLH